MEVKARQRTEEQLRKTMQLLCDTIWNGGTPPKGAHLWSIPVDRDRDFDCILSDAISELVERRNIMSSEAVPATNPAGRDVDPEP